MIVFDLDGTLIDTREAVREAYLAAGVEMPDAAWGKPWHEWLLQDRTTEEAVKIHRKKNELYREALRHYGCILPCLSYALQLGAPIITGASITGVSHVKAWLDENGYRGLNVALSGATYDLKQMWLNTVHSTRGIYVDDDADARAKLRESTRWLITSPEQFLKFTREL